MSGGLAEQSGVIELGDIILEVNNIPIHSAEDLSALVRQWKNGYEFIHHQIASNISILSPLFNDQSPKKCKKQNNLIITKLN